MLFFFLLNFEEMVASTVLVYVVLFSSVSTGTVSGDEVSVLVDAGKVTRLTYRCPANHSEGPQPYVSWFFLGPDRRRRNETLLVTYIDVANGNRIITVADGTLTIEITANDTARWRKYQGQYKCYRSFHYRKELQIERIITISATAHVDLNLRKIPNNDRFEEGSSIKYVCSFRYFENITAIKNVKFRWYLGNDREISTAGRRLTIETDKDFNASKIMTSTLTFTSVLLCEQGRIDCVVEYNSQFDSIISRSDYLVVDIRPIVSIYPLTIDVFESEVFHLTCSVTKCETCTLAFEWFKDGKTIPTIEIHRSTSTSNWTLTNEKGPVVIGCVVNVLFSFGKPILRPIHNSTINILKPKDEVCPNAYSGPTNRSLVWPQTKVNGIAYRQCPNGAGGLCSRICSKDESGRTKFLPPDCRNCESKELKEILNKIDCGGTMGRKDLELIQKQMLNLTAKELNSQDLENAIDALHRLTLLRNTPNMENIRNVVRAISNLLQPINKLSWSQVTQVRPSAAALLMSSVDFYGRFLSSLSRQSSNSAIREVHDFLVLEARSFSADNLPSEIIFSMETSKWNENRSDFISIPSSALDSTMISLYKSGRWRSRSVNIWSSYYRNIDVYLPGTNDYSMNSRVISLTIENMNTSHLKQPISITLQHNTAKGTKYLRRCGFWKFDSFGEGSWSGDGCRVVTSDAFRTVCSCDHLTNFAILMSLNPSSDVALSILSTVGSSISVAALILTIIVYAVTWKEAKSHQAVVLLNLCVALIVANVIFMAGADKVNPQSGCKVVAVLLHYFFLAAFFLMLAEGIQLFIYVVFVLHSKRKFDTTMLIVSAWVLPLIIIAISLGVTKTVGYGNSETCWLSVENHLIWSFIGPALCVIVINAVIIVVVLVRLSASRFPSNKKTNNAKIRGMVWNIAVICPVLGITWLFGVLSVVFEITVFQYIFVVANSSQGLFIFIFHAVFTNKKFNERISSLFLQCTRRDQNSMSKSNEHAAPTDDIGLKQKPNPKKFGMKSANRGNGTSRTNKNTSNNTSATTLSSGKSNSEDGRIVLTVR